MLKYGIMFIDILTFLLDYRDALLITLYVLCCPSNPKNQINWIIISHKNVLLKKLKINMFKMDVKTIW